MTKEQVEKTRYANNINDFDIQFKNIRVFTHGDRIVVQELTEDPRGNFVDKDVTPGFFKYVWKTLSLNINNN